MTAAEASAYHEGRLAAVREQREGGYGCPYRSGARKAAWHRGLADGRSEVSSQEHLARVAAMPEAEREANKAGLREALEAWIARAKSGARPASTVKESSP